MTFSVSPSVTVREVDATAVIPAIAVAPGAIAGVFRWGPVLQRTLITSEDELASRFGKPTTLNPETFFTAADYLSYTSALYVVRANNGANTSAGTSFVGKYPGALGNSLGVAFTDDDGFEEELVVATDEIVTSGNVSINSSTMQLVSEGTEFLSTDGGTPSVEYFLMEDDVLRVGNSTVGYQNLVVDTITVTVSELDDDLDANTAAIDVFTYALTFKNRYSLATTDVTELDMTRLWGFANLVNGAPDANCAHIVVYDADGTITGAARTPLEVYDNVSLTDGVSNPDGTNNYYDTVIDNRSSWINANTSVSPTGRAYETFSGGTDGANESSVTIGALAAGYDLFKEASEVDISVVLTGKSISASLPNYIVSNITEYRKDCIALFSPLSTNVVGITNPNVQLDNVLSFRAQIQNSSYWFMDSGYKYRYDKYNDVYRWVPLNGDMGGLMARIDAWESPAGYKRGLIKNVVKLAFNPNKGQRDLLYGRDINPVITQAGQGTLLFGDKTGLGMPQSAFSRVNVRRLFLTVEKAVATVSYSFLFDFNDEFTQSMFKNLVEPFLRDIQGKRGIIDFRVVSDSTINTPDVIDRNMFRANIFLKPARSINFIELTFVATRTGVEFDEIVGQQI